MLLYIFQLTDCTPKEKPYLNDRLLGNNECECRFTDFSKCATQEGHVYD
jgi:hypothetical protein